MFTASFRRTAVLVSLVAVLATPWSFASAPQTRDVRPAKVVEPASPDLLNLVLSFFRTSRNKTPFLKEGCKLDPDGRCHTSAVQSPQTWEGCKADPNGHCLP
jgi:hypothetical protein